MAISFEGQILAQILVSDLFTGKLGHEPEEREEEGTGGGGRRGRGGRWRFYNYVLDIPHFAPQPSLVSQVR